MNIEQIKASTALMTQILNELGSTVDKLGPVSPMFGSDGSLGLYWHGNAPSFEFYLDFRPEGRTKVYHYRASTGTAHEVYYEDPTAVVLETSLFISGLGDANGST